MGEQIPGPIGVGAGAPNAANNPSVGAPSAGFVSPGPAGIDSGLEPLADRFVTKVDRDWDPTPKPDTTSIDVQAADLAGLAQELGKLPEAGKGGGSLRADPVASGTSAEVTITLHGNLVNRAVRWIGYDNASPAAKAHWDKVLANLKRHEQRHMDIAIEEGDNLAKLLVGHKIGSQPTITDKVSAANDKMQQRQDALDSPGESDHGRKPGHPYGDCNLDPNIK